MLQTDLIRCIQHPQRSVLFIHTKSDCPYRSRLACFQCVQEYKSMDGFEEVQYVLKNPRIICNKKEQNSQGIYDMLSNYFDLLEQDPDEFLSFFKKGILEQIQKLEQDLRVGIEKYKRFRERIAKVQIQFNEALGQVQFRQSFMDILKTEGYHYSVDWCKFEEKAQKYILQFEDQNNQEFKESYLSIKQMEEDFFSPKILSDFQQNTFKCVEVLNDQMANIGIFVRNSSVCDAKYFNSILSKIYSQKNRNIWPKVTLIYKGSQDGLNGKAFWDRCSDKGPTIIICMSKSGYVFGGYTPLKWLPNGGWQKDESQTSFMFSCTRKEIYPITGIVQFTVVVKRMVHNLLIYSAFPLISKKEAAVWRKNTTPFSNTKTRTRVHIQWGIHTQHQWKWKCFLWNEQYKNDNQLKILLISIG